MTLTYDQLTGIAHTAIEMTGAIILVLSYKNHKNIQKIDIKLNGHLDKLLEAAREEGRAERK